jgi:hypothetical protein
LIEESSLIALDAMPNMNRAMPDLPDDPFQDPRYRHVPLAAEIQEGAQLLAAFSNVNSFSGLVRSLRNADHRDVELVALFAITSGVRSALQEAAESRGDAQGDSEDPFDQWMLRDPTTDPLEG